MDSKETRQKFDAIYIAISNGYLEAAYNAFEITLQTAINDKLDQVISIARKYHGHDLIGYIEILKET